MSAASWRLRRETTLGSREAGGVGSSLRGVLCWVQLCSNLQVPRLSFFVCGPPRPAGGVCHPFMLSATMQSPTTAKSLSRIRNPRRQASTDSRVGANRPNDGSMLAFFVCRWPNEPS